jgi:hypothetical protein
VGVILDQLLRFAGGLVAVGLAAAFAVYGAFLAPLYYPGSDFRLPVALVFALVGNPLLIWYTYRVTAHRLAVLAPAAVWCVVWLAASGKTTEGDLLITGDNWVGLTTLFVGPLAFAAGAYLTMIRRPAASTRVEPEPSEVTASDLLREPGRSR